MKRKKRIPKNPNTSSDVASERDLSSMESINEIENEMADEPDRGSIEAVERDYEGRSSDEEDGAIPMDPVDQDPLSEDALRRPSRPPRHNI
jgi:hypothetical protein